MCVCVCAQFTVGNCINYAHIGFRLVVYMCFFHGRLRLSKTSPPPLLEGNWIYMYIATVTVVELGLVFLLSKANHEGTLRTAGQHMVACRWGDVVVMSRKTGSHTCG